MPSIASHLHQARITCARPGGRSPSTSLTWCSPTSHRSQAGGGAEAHYPQGSLQRRRPRHHWVASQRQQKRAMARRRSRDACRWWSSRGRTTNGRTRSDSSRANRGRMSPDLTPVRHATLAVQAASGGSRGGACPLRLDMGRGPHAALRPSLVALDMHPSAGVHGRLNARGEALARRQRQPSKVSHGRRSRKKTKFTPPTFC